MSNVRTENNDGVGIITLCRSDSMNALNDPFIREILTAFYLMQRDEVRVVILRAEKGVKVWSAGRDVESLPAGAHDMAGWQTQMLALGRTIREFPTPVIAMIEGSVWGYSCEVAFSCDLIVSVPEATFAITPAKLSGTYVIEGLRTIVGRLGQNLAREMLFCAAKIEATRLHSLGIINHVVSSDEIETHVEDMARNISLLAPLTITALKKQISDIVRTSPLPAEILAENDVSAENIFGSDDYREGLAAFREKRKPDFSGR
ncbi:MAG: enoyl-CoA hydratase-related protein [Emcibacter sp.]|nr:enoyl-CoA hydratase-related protein [Emcibacter sp.]